MNVTSAILSAWPELPAADVWKKLRRMDAELYYHCYGYWELHPAGDRIDLSAGIALSNARACQRARAWLAQCDVSGNGAPRALQTLARWIERPDIFAALGWEQDSSGGGVGIFGTLPPSTTPAAWIPCAQESFQLPTRITERASALTSRLQGYARPTTVGGFFGRGGPPALRLIVMPTQAGWQERLPEALRHSFASLCAAIPAQSEHILALTFYENRTDLALEVRPSAANTSTETRAWEPWLSGALPDRAPLHQAVISHILSHGGPLRPDELPSSMLLDSFVAQRGGIPIVEARFNHVKIQRAPDGTIRRKLYVFFNTRWVQLG